jgi:voltage-gated potassium channel
VVPARAIFQNYLRPRRHTALLVAIVAAFVVRPFLGDAGAGPVAFSIAMLVLLFTALYAVEIDDLVGERAVLLAQRRRRSIVAWMLAVPAVADRLIVLFTPSVWLRELGTLFWLLFLSFVIWSQLRSVLKHKDVTRETISMSVSIYLLLGLAWGLMYALMFEHDPVAFNFGGSPTPPAARENMFPVWIYFSLTTLSTIGFGDITPVTLQARYAAVAEGITGQFYLAILVARLVAMQMNQAAGQGTGDPSRLPEAGEPTAPGQ